MEENQTLIYMSKNIAEMAKSIKALAESDIRRQEHEKVQAELNARVIRRLDLLDVEVSNIKLQRASEKQARDFLFKWWPVLLIVMSLLVALVPKYIMKLMN